MAILKLPIIALLALGIGLPSSHALAQSWGPAYYASAFPPYPAPPMYPPPYPTYQTPPVYPAPYAYYPPPSAYPPPGSRAYPPKAYRIAYAPVQPDDKSNSGELSRSLKQETRKSAPVPAENPRTKPLKSSQDNHKQAFVQRLLPHIERENQRLDQLRQRLVELFKTLDQGKTVKEQQVQDLHQLVKRYRVDGDPLQQPSARRELMRKVDIIPASLALAQAANESGWGKSRFATEANNLFGIWTYDKDKGLKPRARAADKNHLVRKFDSLGESIVYYMRMLNSHPAYAELRKIRLEARRNGDGLSGLELAQGLEKYSAKGKTYIQLIQQLIEQNQWSRLDQPAA